MIRPGDIRTIRLTPYDMELVRKYASRWTRPGFSSVRSQQERSSTILDDALTGHCGELAFLKHYRGPEAYKKFSAHCERNCPDGGSDLDGSNVDVKSSRYTYKNIQILNHHLILPQRERRLRWVYYFTLVDLFQHNSAALVYLVGWCSEDMLPKQPSSDRRFYGKYALQARYLNPVAPMRWDDFQGAA